MGTGTPDSSDNTVDKQNVLFPRKKLEVVQTENLGHEAVAGFLNDCGCSGDCTEPLSRGHVRALTQSAVDCAVADLAVYGPISLRTLRMSLQTTTGANLASEKATIKRMAEQSVATFTAGVAVEMLPAGKLAKLRNPYRRVWEPCLQTASKQVLSDRCCISRGRFLFQTVCDTEADARDRGVWPQDGPCGKICCNSRYISPAMLDMVLKLPFDVKVSVQTGWGMNTAANAATPTCTRHEGWLGIMRDLCGFIWDPGI